MTRIVVCYQLGDGETLTRRLLDSLREEFGAKAVIDVQDGQNFREFKRADTLVVVIGPTWITSTVRQRESAENLSASLRMVIGSALLNPSISIIPVLLNNTPAPHFASLPLEIQKLTLHEILPCRNEIYERDTSRITHAIRVRNATPRSSSWLAVMAGLVVLFLIVGGLFLFARSETFKSIIDSFEANLERIDPGRADRYRDEGWTFYDAGDYSEAVQSFQKVVQLLASDTSAYDGLGWSYYYLKQYDEAEKSFSRLVELAPGSTSSYMERGLFYQAIDNPTAAIPDFEQVILGSPFNEKAVMALADSYALVGNYAKAVENYQQLVTNINGRNATAYYGLGKANDALKRYKSALDAFQHYLDVETANPDPAVLQRVEELKLLVTP